MMEKQPKKGMRRYLWALGLAALACLAAALWWLWRGRSAPPAPRYLLKDSGGYLALYAGVFFFNDTATTEIYTRLLPEGDVLALQQGVPVYDEAELQKRLEDYGL